MQYWLMKSEPNVFSFDDLVRQGKAEWDGVRNHLAQSHMKAMKEGDLVLFYHSNIGLEVVGVMKIVEEARPDSTDDTGKWIAVHVGPVGPLARSVTLKAIKGDPVLADMVMLKQSRLSVSPVTEQQFHYICRLGGGFSDA